MSYSEKTASDTSGFCSMKQFHLNIISHTFVQEFRAIMESYLSLGITKHFLS